jgi:hypothetical protein
MKKAPNCSTPLLEYPHHDVVHLQAAVGAVDRKGLPLQHPNKRPCTRLAQAAVALQVGVGQGVGKGGGRMGVSHAHFDSCQQRAGPVALPPTPTMPRRPPSPPSPPSSMSSRTLQPQLQPPQPQPHLTEEPCTQMTTAGASWHTTHARPSLLGDEAVPEGRVPDCRVEGGRLPDGRVSIDRAGVEGPEAVAEIAPFR